MATHYSPEHARSQSLHGGPYAGSGPGEEHVHSLIIAPAVVFFGVSFLSGFVVELRRYRGRQNP